jgi:hypothetical protein
MDIMDRDIMDTMDIKDMDMDEGHNGQWTFFPED